MKDPIVQEIRKTRDTHAARFNFRFDAIAADWLKQQAAAKRRGQKFLDLSSKPKASPKAKCARGKARMAARHGFEP